MKVLTINKKSLVNGTCHNDLVSLDISKYSKQYILWLDKTTTYKHAYWGTYLMHKLSALEKKMHWEVQ